MPDKNQFELLVITSPGDFPEEEKYISFFLEEGASGVYLRKENYSTAYLTRILTTIKREYHQKLIFPFSVIDLEIFQQIKPVIHLKEQERLSTDFNAFPCGTLLSTSIHDMSEWEKLTTRFNHMFFSPVFESISKPSYKPDKTIAELTGQIKYFRDKETLLPKLIALGGINENTITLAKEAGFDGAAMLGSIWENDQPDKAFMKIRRKIIEWI